jgi:large subunit ribosomal protein L16
MGKGKGGNEGFVAVVRRGRVLFEIEGVDADLAKQAFTAAHHKLPLKTRMIGRESIV